MSVVSPSQSNPGDEITAAAINNPVNQLAAVVNGNIDANNIADSSISTSKLAAASVTAPKINFGGAGAGIWWEEVGRSTATGTVASLTIATFASRKYLKLLVTVVPTSGLVSLLLRFNGDTAANYAFRLSDSGGADSTGALAGVPIDSGSSSPTIALIELDVVDISGQEKLVFGHNVDAGAGTGSGNPPRRRETHGKWTGTSRITSVTIFSSLTNIGAGSEIIVLGHD